MLEVRCLVIQAAADDEFHLFVLDVGDEDGVAMCGVSVIAFAPCREVAFEGGDEVFRGEAVGLVGKATHAAGRVGSGGSCAVFQEPYRE